MRYFKRNIDVWLLFGVPLFALLLTEVIHRQSIHTFFIWIDLYFKEFAVNYLLFFGIINLFFFINRKVYIGFAALVIPLLALFSYASDIKMKNVGEPIVPWDLSLGKEAGNISGYFVNSTMIFVAVAVLLIVAATVYFVPKKHYRWFAVIPVIAVSSGIITTVYADKPIPLKNSLQLTPITWDQGMNYDQNGLFLGFIMNTQWMGIDKPSDYSKQKIDSITSQVPKRIDTGKGQRPNIIIIQSEAFWDPTLMKEVAFNQDPIPFFHSLQKTQTSGTMLSPVFGGGTVNTEFEVLTGLSTQFLPSGSIAYSQYVRHPINSLANVLTNQGYKSTAVHTYHNWFYERNEVFKKFGFNNFVSKEFFNNPKIKGDFVTDDEMAGRIVDEAQATKGPDFIYGISMENHGPYDVHQEINGTFQVNGSISPQSKQLLERYAETLSDADKSLKQLVQSFQNSNEPTMILFFGDHLPLLGNDYEAYKEAHFISGQDDYSDYLKLHSVPFVVWDNFSNNKDHLKMSANYLGAYMLNKAHIDGGTFWNFIYSQYNSGLPVIPRPDFNDQAFVQEDKLEAYKLLQYDLLFGQGYTYGSNAPPSDHSSYFLGSGKADITAANLDTMETDGSANALTLNITGNYFVKNSVVFINGKAYDTHYLSGQQLSVQVPLTVTKKTVPLEVQVKVKDSLDKVIAESNVFQVPPN